MQLDISKGFLHPEEPISFSLSVPMASQEAWGDELSFDPVEMEGTFTVLKDAVILEGTMKTTVRGRCALCLAPAWEGMEFSFREMFREDADEEEGDSFRYEGKSLPLDHLTLTLCLFHMPMRLVCKGGCAPENDISAYLGHVEDRPQPEEEQPTWQPFAGLNQLLGFQEEDKLQ